MFGVRPLLPSTLLHSSSFSNRRRRSRHLRSEQDAPSFSSAVFVTLKPLLTSNAKRPKTRTRTMTRTIAESSKAAVHPAQALRYGRSSHSQSVIPSQILLVVVVVLDVFASEQKCASCFLVFLDRVCHPKPLLTTEDHLSRGRRGQQPNEVWTVDFKGWWRFGEAGRCEPLTMSSAVMCWSCERWTMRALRRCVRPLRGSLSDTAYLKRSDRIIGRPLPACRPCTA